MNWLEKAKTLFKPKEKLSPFKIEYYPLTMRYYPKYYNCYLHTNYSTGLIEIIEPHLFAYADYRPNPDKAQVLIDLFKEQKLKHGVIVINAS